MLDRLRNYTSAEKIVSRFVYWRRINDFHETIELFELLDILSEHLTNLLLAHFPIPILSVHTGHLRFRGLGRANIRYNDYYVQIISV